MDLCLVTVAGFRRFRKKASLQTNGKLIALLGPNEAGKSSLLRAIALLGTDEPPELTDIARGGRREEFLIEGRFYLSHEDASAAGLEAPHWLILQKRADGGRTFQINPPPPRRNTDTRRSFSNLIEATIQHNKMIEVIPEGVLDSISDQWNIIKPSLSDEFEDLSEDIISGAVEIAEALNSHFREKPPAPLKKLSELVGAFREAEKKLNPNESALRALRKRLPAIVEFDDDARNLLPEYSITSLSSHIPSALDNLCDIAKLDINRLLSAHAEKDTAAITTIEYQANRELEARFTTDWKQSGVKVTIRVQDDRLVVQIVNENSEFTSFAERSDGLRQFVALLAFSGGAWTGRPIMTIDEAEQRLHYDAQADLVQMLARQQVASKVIYTTHSVGCLPEDLGNGVRLAHPNKNDPTQSNILNKFWAANDPGFAPLLFGMGASTLAFLPTRSAVMVEGPSDMLLLPTMFRSALGIDALGFQFVPGLSIGDLTQIPTIGASSRVMFLVDGDQGGETLRKKLIDCGINSKNILTTSNKDKSAVEIEDFIDSDLLLESANSIIKKFHPNSKLISKNDLNDIQRMDSLEKSYKENTGKSLPKVELAYELLDIISANPDRAVLDAKRKSALRVVAQKLVDRFKEEVT